VSAIHLKLVIEYFTAKFYSVQSPLPKAWQSSWHSPYRCNLLKSMLESGDDVGELAFIVPSLTPPVIRLSELGYLSSSS
jgi:hypothetical protein